MWSRFLTALCALRANRLRQRPGDRRHTRPLMQPPSEFPGDVRYSATIGVVCAWVCTPPLTWFLGWRLHLGAYGGWIGLCLEIVVSAAFLAWRVEQRGWAPAAERSRQELRQHVTATPEPELATAKAS